MSNVRELSVVLRHHFSSVGSEEFQENLRKFSPTFLRSLPDKRDRNMGQIKLFEPKDITLPLTAYLASALTGLSRDQRDLIFQLSDTISLVCKRFGIDVYEPRKKTDPVNNPGIEDTAVFWTDRERVTSSDLLIVLCHYPSFGAGEELDFAFTALVPTILVSPTNERISRMVTGVPSLKVRLEYSEPEDLRFELERCLTEIRPVLEQRKLAFSQYDKNILGERIRTRRQELGLTREQVAEAIPHLTAEALRKIEESTDKVSNPSLLMLREVATVLKTTVADLVEPDTAAHVIARLDEWVQKQTAARHATDEPLLPRRDRNRIIRRLLLRIVDSLEDDDVRQGE